MASDSQKKNYRGLDFNPQPRLLELKIKISTADEASFADVLCTIRCGSLFLQYPRTFSRDRDVEARLIKIELHLQSDGIVLLDENRLGSGTKDLIAVDKKVTYRETMSSDASAGVGLGIDADQHIQGYGLNKSLLSLQKKKSTEKILEKTYESKEKISGIVATGGNVWEFFRPDGGTLDGTIISEEKICSSQVIEESNRRFVAAIACVKAKDIQFKFTSDEKEIISNNKNRLLNIFAAKILKETDPQKKKYRNHDYIVLANSRKEEEDG